MRRSRKDRILSNLDGRSIVLLGMMGCGKSAIGRLMATRLGIPFLDADVEIEEAAGRSVADIFAEYGEAEFRRLETRVISRLLGQGPVLLALGGGAFMAEDTRSEIAGSAVSIWLDVELDVLVERVGRKPDKRPLLKTGDPATIIKGLLKEREPIYAKADIRVSSQGGSKSEMRDAVLRELDNYLSNKMRVVKA